MRTLAIDVETYSKVDLTKCGVYAYTEDKDFEILLFAYAFDDEEVEIIDLKSGQNLPRKVEEALTNPLIVKTAFNANFERTCIARYFKIEMPPEQWRCTQVLALSLGLPLSLEGVSRSLGLLEEKMAEGKELIKYFSLPCKATKGNDFKERNLPEDNANKWRTFKKYCAQDVEVERSIRKRLEKFNITKEEQKLWSLDQRVNDRGVMIDKNLISHALICDWKYQEKLKKEFVNLTGIKNPKSAAMMKKWILEVEGIEVDSLSKENVDKLLDMVKSKDTKRALELRKDLSKASIKKYEAMDRALCKDNRIRGLLQFYGANRTGRWAGRLVQVQNLPQNKIKDLDLTRNLLRQGEYEALELLFNSVPEVLSQLIRTAFIPCSNSRFIVSDFSAIEARVIAYLAGEVWRMEVFNSHGKIYEASASEMFKVPIDSITKGSPLRQKGKIAELALGYQGSKGALIAMGALNMGLKEEEILSLVSAWRRSNSKIVKFWFDVERAAITALKDKRVITLQHGLQFIFQEGILFIKLPSGRKLSYVRPRIEKEERFNKDTLTYEGIEQNTKKWGRLKTYGGKLVENIVQAVARDCLADAMIRLDEAGYKVVMHIHDEVVLDVPYGFGSLKEVERIMESPIYWAKGLPLRADSFETNYYKKD
ncbi:hypothetical protein GOM49_10235 [Clostridium bovifaecis]|uniref:DNA-directed DNA polymerase n=1 Tax=Clostridium bovifaecis TaxID=2184719 RepID=A0A6I6FC79_9CLOT|nr:hypothetical protein GOM49_10235 [Clostridium bovifaecis]